MAFKATKKKINGNTPPDDFLNKLVEVAKRLLQSEPWVFDVNEADDIYSRVRPYLGPWSGHGTPYLIKRAAAMCEALRVTASRESSYNWNEGKDPGANNWEAWTMEAGIFQCSSNSMNWSIPCRELFKKITGLVWKNDNTVGSRFQSLTKSDHTFAVEYMMKLMRATVATHGPVKTGLINNDLSREAMAEFESLLGGEAQLPVPTGEAPPWYVYARKFLGKKETDPEFNKYMSSKWPLVGLDLKTIATSWAAWCGLFVAVGLAGVGLGVQSQDGALARGWRDHGVEVVWKRDGIPKGAIVWINHKSACDSSSNNHVAFANGDCAVSDLKKSEAMITLYGGNQSNMAKESDFPVNDICGVRWPIDDPKFPKPGPVLSSNNCSSNASSGDGTQ